MRWMYFWIALVLVWSNSSVAQAQDIACCELPFSTEECVGTGPLISAEELQGVCTSINGTFFPGESCDAGVCLPPVSAVCGNGSKEDLEECDEGTANSDEPNALCRTDCTLAGCGDMIVDPDTEQCDDGNFDPTDGCDECMLTLGKTQVCHKGRTIEVGNAAVPAHVRHGDTLGLCPK